ncbi:MAG: hypothetical protein J6X28_01015 [Bacilli bacterium]|nr:hypothetical protein [Bacilli bacterium]
MKNELLTEINRLKKDLVVSSARFSLVGGEEENQDVVLNSILLGWMEPIHNFQDFVLRYESFQKLRKLIYKSYLFEAVETIASEKVKDMNQIRHTMSIYDSLTHNEEYQKYSSICGYKIPIEFGRVDSYQDDSLKEKIEFYQLFSEKLEEIYRTLLQKGGSIR